MDWLRWFFLESVPALVGVLGVVLFVLLVYWRRGASPRPLLVGLLAGAAMLILQAVVVTPREHADAIMNRIEADVRASRVDAIRDALSPAFQIESPHWGREEFLDVVRGYMRRVDVRTLTRRLFELSERKTDGFRLTVSYLADIRARDFSGAVLTRWRIDFERREDGWRIRRIVPLEINHQIIRGWRGLRRL